MEEKTSTGSKCNENGEIVSEALLERKQVREFNNKLRKKKVCVKPMLCYQQHKLNHVHVHF